MRSRVLWWAGAASVLVTLTIVGVRVQSAGPAAAGAAAPRAVSTRAADAVSVLRRWDRRRASAWAAGDPGALRRLYVAGSRTGRLDVHDLERWHERGLRVTGLRQQVATLVVRRRTPDRLTVLVTDRTVDGVALGAGVRRAVPTSAWAAQRVTLRHVRGTWLVGEARDQPAR